MKFLLSISSLIFTLSASADSIFPISLGEETPKYCDREIRPTVKNGSDCPFPPKRKNGKNCFAASPTDMSRHAAGYGDYVERHIVEAVEKTKEFTTGGIDPLLIMSVISKESWFNPMSTNSWGDVGISQFQMSTAQSTLDYMRELGMDVSEKVNKEVPPNCKPNSFNVPLSSKCFDSIKSNCEQEPYSRSMFCPNFALNLMAFHFLQIQESEIMVRHKGKDYNLNLLLAPPGDDEAQIRYLASVYNRGPRIFNSAYHSFIRKGKWPTAKRYGALWNVQRPIPQSRDPFDLGNLRGHYINRCYVWAISGLCGGVAESVVAKYTDLLCPSRNPGEQETDTSEELYRLADSGPLSMKQVMRELKDGHKLTTDQLHFKLELARSLYEGDNRITIGELLSALSEIRNHAFSEGADNKNLELIIKSYKSHRSAISTAQAIRQLNENARVAKGALENNLIRAANLRALRSIAKRNWKSSKTSDWLFLSGAAGFFLYNSGQTDLKNYIALCEEKDNCRYVKQAKRFYKLGQGMQLDRSYREE